jgi:hypothetical protein
MNQPQAPALVDPGNPFVGQPYPASLQVGLGQGPNGPCMVLTIRCGPATLTVLLGRDDAQNWAKVIAQQAALVSPLIIPNGMPPVPRVDRGEA